MDFRLSMGPQQAILDWHLNPVNPTRFLNAVDHHIRYVLPRYLKSEKKLKRSPTTEGKCGDIGFDATIYGGGPVEEAAAVRTETVAFPRLT
ncbi:BnaA09g12840D [Brassica napus]|uniref:(rape) hypothetical protein n=1 Tax=Brassica napus TaxID=3708 RepID=A0A078I7L1_BRANA|nr:unnamed protein product [Brassica napus]CDY46910.1 BnaA09g12840D [Brassica napus]